MLIIRFVIKRVHTLEQGWYPNRSITRWSTPNPTVTFQFSNHVSEIARSTRQEVVKTYNLPPEGQAEGMESTLAANTTDFAVRTTIDLGKTTRIVLPPSNGTAKAHTALWWLCRASSSVSFRSGLVGGKIGLNRGDSDTVLFLSAGREGMGDEDLREIGAGSLGVSVSV